MSRWAILLRKTLSPDRRVINETRQDETTETGGGQRTDTASTYLARSMAETVESLLNLWRHSNTFW
jgi:hypothetical protein